MSNQSNQQDRFKRFRNRPCGCNSATSNNSIVRGRTVRKPNVQGDPYQNRSHKNRSIKSRFTY